MEHRISRTYVGTKCAESKWHCINGGKKGVKRNTYGNLKKSKVKNSSFQSVNSLIYLKSLFFRACHVRNVEEERQREIHLNPGSRRRGCRPHAWAKVQATAGFARACMAAKAECRRKVCGAAPQDAVLLKALGLVDRGAAALHAVEGSNPEGPFRMNGAWWNRLPPYLRTRQ